MDHDGWRHYIPYHTGFSSVKCHIGCYNFETFYSYERIKNMNFAMWKKALNIIPSVTKEEWDQLDLVSKWLISTRAAVLIMTFLSAALAGLFALHDHEKVNPWAWLALTLGLVLAHA